MDIFRECSTQAAEFANITTDSRKTAMPLADHLFIRPLLGADNTWAAYRAESAAEAECDTAVVRLCASPHLAHFDHRLPWFIPARPGIQGKCRLNERAVFVFPSVLPEEQSADFKQFELNLRQNHSRTAFAASPSAKLPATGAWDYLLIRTSHARTLPPFTLLGLSSKTILVATEVVSHADRQWILGNACSLSSGEYLLSRATSTTKASTTRVKLLELLSLITQDADTGALEEIFRQEAKLSYSLLRLVNSAALAPRSPITSFSQAINLLGRRQLQRWLQLLVFADPNNGHHPNPLLQKAAARGRMLELLAPMLNPPPAMESVGDAAFMVGTFSLLDVLLNMSMSEILHQLPLAQPVHDALAARSGTLGILLHALELAESGDLKNAAEQIDMLGIAPTSHLDAQLEALSWAARIHHVA